MLKDRDAIEASKELISNHEQMAREGDIEKVCSNIAEDIVLLAADAPLVVGLASFQQFYGVLLDTGEWDFQHIYEGADVIDDTVTLFGVSRGTVTFNDGHKEPIANNFIITVRHGEHGPKIWRAAFAPAGE